eukprot:91376-Pelagomonas_calceolata.AAC.8
MGSTEAAAEAAASVSAGLQHCLRGLQLQAGTSRAAARGMLPTHCCSPGPVQPAHGEQCSRAGAS